MIQLQNGLTNLTLLNHTIDANNKTWSWNISTSAGAETGAWVIGSSRLGQDTNLAW